MTNSIAERPALGPRSKRVLAGIAGLALMASLASPSFAGTSRPDPLRSAQWGLDRIEAQRAWQSSRGKGALIAIVDTGVDLDHPDLARHLVVVDGADLLDPDGCIDNGCVDDGPDDPAGHGTAVAGIAAAVTDNGVGVAGVAPRARIMPIRARYADDRTLEMIPKGIVFAADHGADVINVSFSVPAFPAEVEGVLPTDPFERYIHEFEAAVDYAWKRGAVIIAAAGNGYPNAGQVGGPPFGAGKPACGAPGFDPRVICVGAVDRSDQHAYYSDFDALRATNFIVAPSGGDVSRSDMPAEVIPCEDRIATTFPVEIERACPGDLPPGYTYLSGTSSSTAFTSGVAALLVSEGLSNDEVMAAILSSADDLGAPGWDPLYGYGRVNAAKAVGADSP